jgi:hypothetical protein
VLEFEFVIDELQLAVVKGDDCFTGLNKDGLEGAWDATSLVEFLGVVEFPVAREVEEVGNLKENGERVICTIELEALTLPWCF